MESGKDAIREGRRLFLKISDKMTVFSVKMAANAAILSTF